MNQTLTKQVGTELDSLRDARTYKRFLTLESPQGPGPGGDIVSSFRLHFWRYGQPLLRPRKPE